ncbi:MAG: inorganic phosphate transporter [Gemmatimonadales bacterium]
MLDGLLLAVMLSVAFANGANDVSKGIATLVGSGVTNYRRAVLWGTLWTVAGGLTAALLARGLVAVFSGTGLLATDPDGASFLLATGAGAIGWLVVATRSGLPVSTTHALVGGLLGAGIAAQGIGAVQWAAVARTTAIPLAVSPLLAAGLMLAAYPLVRTAFRRVNRYCVCVERAAPVMVTAPPAAVLTSEAPLRVIAGAECPPTVVARVTAMDSLHWLTAGATSFSRGLNDAPKILALGVLAATTTGVTIEWLFGGVALAMGAGSYWAGRRVTATLAGKVTSIAPDDGFAANLVTAALVGAASWLALPVSTTHVSSGAIAAVGARKRAVSWPVVREMLATWVVTLPVAGLIAALSYFVLSRAG